MSARSLAKAIHDVATLGYGDVVETSVRQLDFTAVLGKGGFGEVYLANLRGAGGFRRRVAVKVMRDGLDGHEHLAARQRDEARLLGLIAHENIVQVLELTSVAGRPAVIMEYVEGSDLAELQRARAGRPVPPRAVVELLARTASALAAAWTAVDPDTGQPLRVVHRDVKPANLLLTPSGAVKVLDFGIARAEFDREGLTGSVQFGTPRYMAPEQWLGEPTGAPVDVYALGVTALELLRGRAWERAPLGEEAHDARVAQAVREALLPPVAPESPDTLAPFRALLLEMLRHRSDARPSAEAAARVLRRLADDPGMPGETLATLAAREVPPVLAHRRAALATEPLPTPPSGTPTSTPATPPAPAATPPTPALPSSDGAVVAPAPTAATAAAPADPRLRYGVAAVASGAALLTVALLWRPVAPEPVTPEPQVPPAPSVDVDPPPTQADPPPAPPPVTAPAAGPQGSASGRGTGGVTGGGAPRPMKPTRPAPTSGAAVPATTTMPAAPLPAAPPASATPALVPFRVITDPMGATIAVDGVTVGTSPRTLRLAPGAHRLRLTLEGTVVESDVLAGEGMASGIRHDFNTGNGSTLR